MREAVVFVNLINFAFSHLGLKHLLCGFDKSFRKGMAGLQPRSQRSVNVQIVYGFDAAVRASSKSPDDCSNGDFRTSNLLGVRVEMMTLSENVVVNRWINK